MSIQKINEGQIILAILTELLMICSSLSCSGRTMIHSGITDYDKQIIIDMHNRMRQSIALGHIVGQPPAANMMELKWDNELANRAQQWSTSCSIYKHDPRRHNSRYLVGQNSASVWTTKQPANYYDMQPNFSKDAIEKWFNEVRDFNYGPVVNALTGHYSQLIWAQTTAIGCGFAFYLDPSKRFKKYYVCNYGPSGNVEGELPYQKGYPNCYIYGLVNSKKYSGLCDTPVSDYFGAFKNLIG